MSLPGGSGRLLSSPWRKGKLDTPRTWARRSCDRRYAKYLECRCGVSYDPNTEILISVGVSEALDLALRALLNPGDEVIYHEPSYVSYSPSVLLCHGKPVPVRTSSDREFRVLAEDIERVITPRSKALLLSFPTNPTGGILSAADLKPIADLCRAPRSHCAFR